jgi:hypothetical protein
MGLAALAILAWGVAGHFLLAIGYVNRLHGLALPRRRFKLCELPAVASVILAPAAVHSMIVSIASGSCGSRYGLITIPLACRPA